jgi:Fibronectin type III domain/Iron/zinc purple acid phosphatase-like protein C
MAALATSAMAATNLLANGDFEGGGSGSLTGWKGSSATLALVPGDGGGFGAQATRSSGGTYGIANSGKLVTSAAAGAVYVADGRFNAPSGKSVCLKLKEAGSSSATVTSCTNGTGAWATLPELTYTVKSSGDSLSFFVVQKKAATGDSFSVDNLSVATASGTTIAPPTNLHATAVSSTEVDLTWNASTTSGLSGYHVYRNGGAQPYATVGASASSFDDTNAQPSTTYSYTVTAFDSSTESDPSNSASATTPSGGGGGGGGGGMTFAIAGDIACASTVPTSSKCHQQATANLISSRLSSLNSVFTAGDNQYPCGALSDFQKSYDNSWGAFLNETHPTIGDQDIGASTSCDGKPQNGYFQYFGARAQPNGTNGYYYLDFSSGAAHWRVIDLNGNCTSTPCSQGSPQEQFLQNAINTTPSGSCIMAIWHQPYFSGSSTKPHSLYKAFWNDLYAAHAALVLNGHAHYYERFKPQDPSGNSDPTNGVTQIIVGTGGVNHGSAANISPNTVVYDNTHWGATFFTLNASSVDWQFVSEGGQTLDSGTRSCTPQP